MEFNEKLQELRKQKGITQEELAEALFVSRTAVSKWESGRGYPNIDSLKALAKFFSVTVDELLSGDELLVVAEEDNKQKENRFLPVVLNGVNGAVCNRKALCLPVTAVFRQLSLSFAVPSVSPLLLILPSWMWCAALVGRCSGFL